MGIEGDKNQAIISITTQLLYNYMIIIDFRYIFA